MSEEKPKTKTEQLEEKRAARKEEAEKARAEQYEKDLEALDALETEHGDGSVAKLEVRGHVPGLPTLVVVKSPGLVPGSYKRYTDRVRKAGKNAGEVGEATDQLGEACIAYPTDPDTLKALYKAFPGTKVSAALQALKFVELEGDDAKKG